MQKEVLIPVNIFNTKLGSLESIVKYLKETGLKYSEISVLINRDPRTVWNVHKNTKKKHPENFKLNRSTIQIPCSILKNRKLSVLESICLHLINEEFSVNEIALLLKRNYKTIWTAYSRVYRKL